MAKATNLIQSVNLDIEAATYPITDTIAMLASKLLKISHEDAMKRTDIQEAGKIVTLATLELALGNQRWEEPEQLEEIHQE